MTKSTRNYLRISDLSKKLAGRSKSSLYRDIKNGQLPNPIRIGARLYWIEEEVDDYLETRRIGGTQSC